jgi:uncharacterized protein
MTKTLPAFRYHPDPVANGIVAKSDVTCVCCDCTPGYIYRGPVFAVEDLDGKLCPWCIADGTAAEKFSARFVDSDGLLSANMPREVIDHVAKRTPGYVCWQSQQWQAHCNDACAYHGDASVEDVANASRETINAWKAQYGMQDADWIKLSDGYEPKGHSAFYKFVCLHCDAVLLSWDMD